MAPRKLQAFSLNLLVRKFSANGKFPPGCITQKLAETLFTETLLIRKLYENAHTSRVMETHPFKNVTGELLMDFCIFFNR